MFKKKTILTFYIAIIGLCYLPIVVAQKHDNIWKMGEKNDPIYPLHGGQILNFNFPNPILYEKNCQLRMELAGLAMSDSLGALQFYTDGARLRNADDSVVPGGNPFNAGNQWANGDYGGVSGVLCVPRTGYIGEYYLFYYSYWNAILPNQFKMSLVKKDKITGKFHFLIKDRILIDNDGSYMLSMAMTKHANGRDWWLMVTRGFYEPTFATFLVQPDTVIGPTYQTLGNTHVPCDGFQCWYSPPMGFSLDGSLLFDNRFGSLVNFYHFDRCNGQLSFWKGLDMGTSFGSSGGGIISKSNQYYYQARDSLVYQYKLWDDDMIGSRQVVVSDRISGGTPTMQHGPDGRVYATSTNPQPLDSTYTIYDNFLQGINFPDKEGLTCGASSRFLRTPKVMGYPPNYPNYRLGAIDGSPCDTLGLDNHPLAGFRWDYMDTLSPLAVEFTDNSWYEPATWHWDFGGLATSQDTSPVFTFPQPGVYDVCLTVCNPNSCDTVCHEVVVGVSSANQVWAESRFSVFPNPTSDLLHIQADIPGACTAELLDLLGHSLRRVEFSGRADLTVADMPLGLYVLRFWQDGRVMGMKKVVVAR